MLVLATLDPSISVALNAMVGAHPAFDSFVFLVSNNHFLKSLPPAAAFWFLWFAPHPAADRRRATLLLVLAGTLVTLATARILARVLPFRHRPLAEAELGLTPVPEIPMTAWFDNASSLPSDHAALFFCLATGLFIVSRRIGVLAFVHALVVALLPRVYLGLHYASDIVVGALLGASIAWLLTRARIVDRAGPPMCAWLAAHPAVGYTGLFVLTSQLASMFQPLRDLGGYLRDLLL